MFVRKFSFLFFILSIIAGILGATIGEWFLASFYGIWPNMVLMGVYFGQLALIAGLFYLLAELISPVINGRGWRLEYSSLSWKVLVPASIGMLFLAGLAFQFLYSVNFSKTQPPDDLVIVLDISDSMNESDPNRESHKAAIQLIANMEPTHRAAVLSFNEQPFVTKEMFAISDKAERDSAIGEINQLQASGGTDIGLALDTAIKQIDDHQQQGRKPMVILFSDGYSELNLEAAIAPYEKNGIVIHTIGMSEIDRGGARLLKEIALGTGGSFNDVKNANELTNVFKKIYLENQDRLLVTERYGVFKDNSYLAVLRVLLIAAIGSLFGLMLGMVFDNRYLAKSYCITGFIGGILAGLVLELGLQNPVMPLVSYRTVAAVLLTVVTGLGTLLIPVKEKFSGMVRPTDRPDFSTRGSSSKGKIKKTRRLASR